MSHLSINKFSIITCTFNPDLNRLRRVIESIVLLNKRSDFEYIIVDNNSSEPIENIIKSDWRNIKLIKEVRQGLSHARIAGANASINHWIVFFDDDNLPDRDFLLNLEEEIKRHPEVGVWGPGKVDVEFESSPPHWVEKYFTQAFQKKDLKETQFGCNENWPNYFPPGSGLCIKRSLFLDYVQNVQTGKYTITGRKGAQLTSGEDAQIVWHCCNKGIPVGSSSKMQLTHIIPIERTSLKYLQKLYLNLSKGYYEAKSEVFGEDSIEKDKPKLFSEFRKIIHAIKKSPLNPVDAFRIYSIERNWLKGFPSKSKY